MSIDLIKHSLQSLFPDGPLWETKYRNDFEKFIEGIAAEYLRQKEKNDQIPLDFFPDTTTLIDEWVKTFGLPINPLLTEQQERDRLKGTWRSLSVGTMQAANMLEVFNLSGITGIRIRPLTVGEDPRDFFLGSGVSIYGDQDAEYGDSDTQYGALPGENSAELVVNCGLVETVKQMDSVYGDSGTQYGGNSLYGEFLGYIDQPVTYDIPDDPDFWGLFYVIESETGDIAEIQTNLQDTFHQLVCLTKPVNMWAILRVRYVG